MTGPKVCCRENEECLHQGVFGYFCQKLTGPTEPTKPTTTTTKQPPKPTKPTKPPRQPGLEYPCKSDEDCHHSEECRPRCQQFSVECGKT